MSKPIKISVVDDSKAFAQGLSKNVIDPLDDAEDALKDVAKASDKAGDQLEDSMKDAQKRTDALVDEYEQLGDAISEASRRGGRGLKDSVADSTSAAKADLAELKDEAIQNASETFSSFDGSAESFADGIQGTLGGIVSSMGPVGMALGAAGALGMGTVIGALDKAGEANEEYKAKVSELGAELIDTGGVGAEAIENMADRMRDLATETDDNQTSLRGLERDSKRAVHSYEDLAQAMAGNVEQLDEMIAGEEEYLESIEGNARFRSASQAEQLGAQRRIVEGLKEQRDAMRDAQEVEEAWIRAGGPALEARAEAMETLQGEVDEAISAWSDYVDAETGAIDPAAYIAGMTARREATANFNSNVQQLATDFDLSHDEIQAILDQGLDFAPHLQTIIDSGLSGAYVAEVQAGLNAGQAIIDGTPLNAKVAVFTDITGAEVTLAEAVRPRQTTVDADADTTEAERQITSVETESRQATISVGANTMSAQNAINAILNGYYNKTIYVDVVERNRTSVDW